MANADQLKRISDGVSAWNDWRRKNPGVAIDLSGAVLHETRTPWHDEVAVSMDLEGINLSGAHLESTVLKGANLRRADLSKSTLRYANLRRADLSGANLQNAKLNSANLTLATLRDANLDQALFWETILARTDLRNVVGLVNARHGGPSVIDHRTLQRSGALPREFLRGLGLPDVFIDNLATVVGQLPYADCFISFASADQEFADRLYRDLQAAGVRCWYAPKHLAVGAKTRQGLVDAIRANERLIVVISRHSIASSWVETEVETAFEEERTRRRTVLLPVRIDDDVMTTNNAWAGELRRRNIADFTGWRATAGGYRIAFRKLLSALAAT